jgi:protease I
MPKRRSPRATAAPSRKVLIPIGDATEVMDTMYPMFRLPEDGYEAVVAGPEARLYHGVLHEIPPGEPKWDITRESPAYHIRATIAFRDVKPEQYCGLFVSGGRAPEYLRYDEDLLRITRHFFEAGKPVAMVCHGIEILTAAGVIGGRTVTTVAKCRLDVEQGGAKYVDRSFVVDGNLVSARTWNDNSNLMREFMRMLREATA